jgi:hypothetical protein
VATDDYRSASQQIGSDPASYNEKQMTSLLSKVAGPEVVAANVASFLSMKKRGFRYDGPTTVLSTKASQPSDVGYGIEVVVTRCIDQRSVRVLDRTGEEVPVGEVSDSIPEFNLRQYAVQHRSSEDGFRVYGIAPAKGTCGP